MNHQTTYFSTWNRPCVTVKRRRRRGEDRHRKRPGKDPEKTREWPGKDQSIVNILKPNNSLISKSRSVWFILENYTKKSDLKREKPLSFLNHVTLSDQKKLPTPAPPKNLVCHFQLYEMQTRLSSNSRKKSTFCIFDTPKKVAGHTIDTEFSSRNFVSNFFLLKSSL